MKGINIILEKNMFAKSPELDLHSKSLTLIPDLSKYDHVEKLVLSFNYISVIEKSKFPPNLKILEMAKNAMYIFNQNDYPDTLEELKLCHNYIQHMDCSKMSNLKKLFIKDNKLQKLTLPSNLIEIDASSNYLNHVILPDKLLKIYMDKNEFHIAPRLPNGVQDIKFSSNKIYDIMLPNSLIKVDLIDNLIISVSNLPPNIEYIDLSENVINRIDAEFPDSLRHISLDNNKISEMPKFNDGIQQIDMNNNLLTTLKSEDIPFSVIRFSCSHNFIGNIPEELRTRKGLTFIYMYNNATHTDSTDEKIGDLFDNKNSTDTTFRPFQGAGYTTPLYQHNNSYPTYTYVPPVIRSKNTNPHYISGIYKKNKVV